MSARSILITLALLFGLWTFAQCVATAPATDIRALIASAKGSPEGQTLIAESLAKTPAPSNYELAGIKSALNIVLAREASRSVSPAASAPAPAASAPAPALVAQSTAPAKPSALTHPVIQVFLIAAFLLMIVKLTLTVMRPRGPY